jgi:hypothetical protein
MASDHEWLPAAERTIAITIWIASVGGLLWGSLRFHPKPLSGAGLYLPALFWIALTFAALDVHNWATTWVNRKNNYQPRFSLKDWPGSVPPKGRYIRMDADLRQPVARRTILSATRRICASRLACGVALGIVFLIGSLALKQAWMFATACGLAAAAGFEIYPRRAGIRYHTGFLAPDSVVREICLGVLYRALKEEIPIQDWHPEYFRLIQIPSDGSQAEFTAASWTYTYALLGGDLETAARSIERTLALLPLALLHKDAPLMEYIGLGDAIHFYTVVSPDESTCTPLLQRIQGIQWDLPQREAYIEAAIALATGDREQALEIAQAELDSSGSHGGSAWTQLHRELLLRCRDKAA